MSIHRRGPSTAALALATAALAIIGPVGATAARPPVTRPLTSLESVADTTTIESLLERSVAAAGGREAFEAITTRVMRVRVVTDLAWDPPVHNEETLTVYARHPGRYLIVQASEKGTTLEGCDGEACWRRNEDGTVAIVEPKEPRSAWLTDPRFAARLEEHFPGMSLVGIDELPEGRAYVGAYDDVETHRIYFDAETGLLLRLGFNRELRDYKEFDGVLLPTRVAQSRKGGSSVFYVESVHHDVPLDDALFAPPGGSVSR